MELGQNTHFPKINTPEHKKIRSNLNMNTPTLPSINKSSYDDKSDSLSSSDRSSASLVSKTSLVKKNITKNSSSSTLSRSSDSNVSDKIIKKRSTINKYYYLQPTYIHPERIDLPERTPKRRNLEVPIQMAFKFTSYVTNEKWREALKICKKILSNYHNVSKIYKDFYIMLNTLMKVKENMKRIAPKKDRKPKEKKEKKEIERRKDKEIPTVAKLSIMDKEEGLNAQTTDDEELLDINKVKKEMLSKTYNEPDFESLSSKRTSINDQAPTIRVELNEKQRNSYMNPTNTYVQINSVLTGSNSEDEDQPLYQDTEVNDELDKVMNEFYNQV